MHLLVVRVYQINLSAAPLSFAEGAEILSTDNEIIGKVTSGIPSPSLGVNIAMGYVKNGFHKKETEVQIVVRKVPRKAVVTAMPFVPTNYWRGSA